MTLQRLILCLLLLVARASLAAPVRPPGTGTGPVVARVHLRGGLGTVIRAGSVEFPAAPGLALLRSDELRVPPGEFLVVALDNGYLVRIDEDLTLRVRDIVLLGAPRTQQGLGEQLDRLVTREEKVQAERIAGTPARRAGAESMPAQAPEASPPPGDAAPPPPPRPPAGPSRTARGGAAAAPPRAPRPPPPASTSPSHAPVPAAGQAPPASRPPPSANTFPDDSLAGDLSRPAPRPTTPPSRASEEERDREARAAAEAREERARAAAESQAQRARAEVEVAHARAEAEARARATRGHAGSAAPGDPLADLQESSPPPPPPAPEPTAQPPPSKSVPAPAVELPEGPRLRQCLARELGRLPLAIPRVTVRVKLAGGRIQRVVLGGGLPTPACAREILLLKDMKGMDGQWLTTEITLR